MHQQAVKAMRLILAGEVPLLGKPKAWAARIVYFWANRDRRAWGVSFLVNSEVESFFGVTIGTIRKRAAHIEGLPAA